ncbi:MAG: hypothetical protein U9R15_18930 [Chloroflexota bacterium]|nr:hypothetical protein [Chloroflexota bacterium]
MEAYKFETTIQENGVIQIPEMARLTHQRVEIFVVISAAINQESRKPQSVENFLDKWRGFLKGFNPDELKAQYLQEKYE